MAWPSSADIDTTKLDSDNDSIKDSRVEINKMAGYVNDIITAGPGGLNLDLLEVGDPNTSNTVRIGPSSDTKSLQIIGGGEIDSTGHQGPAITLGVGQNSNISFTCYGGGTLQINNNAVVGTSPAKSTLVGYYKVVDQVLGVVYIPLYQ